MSVYARQAIQTKYIGPSNFRGSRVKASAEAGSITLHWDHALNSEENHTRAAKTFADKYGWSGNWHIGALPGRGYAFVWADEPAFIIEKTQVAA
jgi:hypothetical protein